MVESFSGSGYTSTPDQEAQGNPRRFRDDWSSKYGASKGHQGEERACKRTRYIFYRISYVHYLLTPNSEDVTEFAKKVASRPTATRRDGTKKSSADADESDSEKESDKNEDTDEEVAAPRKRMVFIYFYTDFSSVPTDINIRRLGKASWLSWKTKARRSD